MKILYFMFIFGLLFLSSCTVDTNVKILNLSIKLNKDTLYHDFNLTVYSPVAQTCVFNIVGENVSFVSNLTEGINSILMNADFDDGLTYTSLNYTCD